MKRFNIEAKPICPNVVWQREHIRVTLLTAGLLRLEKGTLTDKPTQTVWNRDLGEVDYTCEEAQGLLTVETDRAVFLLDVQEGEVRYIIPNGMETVTDFESGNLLGTARTLDNANGAVKLEPGILSRSGVSVMDDSKSLLLGAEGGILPREKCSDRYYFAYGHDYLEQLRDFFRLTGPVPLIPKFALGNWWSRYRAYTQEEYRQLMEKFLERKIPISVATIDMDWHWTDVLDRFGEEAKPGKPRCKEEVLFNTWMPGWTGYSWNTELFPDHRELLNWLHEKGFKVPLNVHPSQGIRAFEDCYGAVCASLEKDPEKKELIPFDITDPAFVKSYFDDVHHPLEAEGVDFWWLDWQQGKKTDIKGLDPLWALNHYHTLDRQDGKRPLILSRYAGLGSHRYPLGFSGDTICTWKSLDFQPYFTNTAANAGYTWWSHDIGGHMRGIQDDELYLRWLQYGVFSPINRLHSTNSDYMGKEPWKRSWAVGTVAEEYLRLRQKLIPYLYSANYRTHTRGEPICMPLYYRWDREEAYRAKNPYIFGGQLLVCPITKPADKRLNLAMVEAWLPEGRWTDIFNGRVYKGGRWVKFYRDIHEIPVLAQAGAIIPMYQNGDTNDLSTDQPLEIHLFRGTGKFTLYEDDGETLRYQQGDYAMTTFRMEAAGKDLRLTILPPENGMKRKLILKFRDLQQPDMTVELENKPVEIHLSGIRPRKMEPKEDLRISLLTRVQGANDWKGSHFGKNLPGYIQDALSELDALDYEEEYHG